MTLYDMIYIFNCS